MIVWFPRRRKAVKQWRGKISGGVCVFYSWLRGHGDRPRACSGKPLRGHRSGCRGPAGTDMNSMLVFLQDKHVNVLGITVVTGDGWRDEEVAHTLRLLELVGRTDISGRGGGLSPGTDTRVDAPLGTNLRQDYLPGRLEQLPPAPRPLRNSEVAGRLANHQADRRGCRPLPYPDGA